MENSNKGEKVISRRSFVKATGVAAASLTATGFLASVGDAEAAVIPQKWDKTADVVVVGGGGAGLFAALSAAESGANVLLLEKAPNLMLSTSAICGGGVSAAETKVERDYNLTDSKKLFMEELIKAGDSKNDPEILDVFVENAAYTVDWFYDKGVKFFPRGYPGFSVNRQHSNMSSSGREYIEVLTKELEKNNVPILFETPATRLFVHPETGEVAGVEASQGDSKITVKARKAVILTTGGYAGSYVTIDRFLIPFKGALTCASPTGTGDGFLMANKIGATVTHMGYGAVYAYGLPTDPKRRRGVVSRAYEMAAVYGAIIVNKNGKRFVREETSPTGVALKLVEQPEQTLYVVGDKPMMDAWLQTKMPGVIGWTHNMVNKEAVEQKVFISSADSLDALASKTGMNAENLKKTVSLHNGYVDAGVDPEFARAKANLRKKIETPPFYALSGRPIALASTGGLKIDKNMRVLDPYLVPIPRLYAAGEIIGGLHGQQYLGGCGFGSALTFGRLAGAAAAKEKSV
jgi:flavocytochrome c